MLSNLDLSQVDLTGFPPAERAVLQEYLRRKQLRSKGGSFLDFVQYVAPWFVFEEVHCLIADHLEQLKRGDIDRLLIQMAPRTGKSLMTSELLPAWWVGHFPSDKVLHAAYASTLVEKFGRKVRNMLMADEYRDLFPGTVVSKDSRASAQWATTLGGEYNAVGVGGGVAGKGGNLLIIDDPVSEQDMFSKSVMDSVYEWWGAGWYSRRQPDRNAFLITMCMTGDTPVLMADGTEKPLINVRAGDMVATYDDGMLSTAPVLGHKSSGCDTIFTIQLRSGRILRANERHPFLVDFEGEQKWMRLRELQAGVNLVRLKDAGDTHDQIAHRDYAQHVLAKTCTAGSTPIRHHSQTATMVKLKENHALSKGVQSLLFVKGYAKSITTQACTLPRKLGSRLNTAVMAGLNSVTGLIKRALMNFSPSREEFALFAASHRPARTPERIGTTSYASITATTQMSCEGYSATTATLRLGMLKPPKPQNLLLDTSDFTVDEIVSIEETGYEEVFDVQIGRTENFIANGVVSHNTRWRADDIVGRLLADAVTIPGADQWTQLRIPAILDDESAAMLNRYSDDPHLKEPRFYRAGDSFSPRRWSLEELNRTKATITRKAWAALYLQSPVEEGGGILLRDHWKPWKSATLPKFEYILQSYDTAFEEGEHNDYSARTTWGAFVRESDRKMCVMLLERMKERLSFPNLLVAALESYKEYKPDRVIVEKAASGTPLIQEFRKRGVPVAAIRPVGSKVARANAAAVMLEQGVVYYPYGKRWAEDVLDDCAVFPNGAHDDVVDSTVYALNYMRRLFMLETPDDAEDDDDTEPTAARPSYARRRTRISDSDTTAPSEHY